MADQTNLIDASSRQSLTAASSSDGVTIVRLYANPTTHRLLVDASGSPVSLLTATGTVNDANVTFTFTSAPQIVVVNGLALRQGHGWSIATLTVTLDNPVGTGGDIYGIL